MLGRFLLAWLVISVFVGLAVGRMFRSREHD
jgi:hypothetical protein